ncbi:MAG: ABC transporter ATP-binding protein [Patescibacteria group bacterium]
MKQKNSTQHSVKQVIGIYLKYVWQYKLLAASVVVTVVLANLFLRYIPPLIVAQVIDDLGARALDPNTIWQDFGPQMLAYCGLSVLGGIVLWRMAVIFIWTLELKIVQQMHADIFRKLLELDATFHSNKFGGSLVTQANKFTSSYVRIFDTTVFDMTSLVLSFVFTAVILLPRAPMVVLFLGVFSALYLVISLVITRHVRHLNAIEASASSRQTGFLADMVTNIMAVKSHATFDYEQSRYKKATDTTLEAGKTLMQASMKTDIFFSTSTTFLAVGAFMLAIVSVVVWGASVATAFLVVSYTAQITQELWNFGRSTLRNYNRAFGDAQEMVGILNTEPSIADDKTATDLTVTDGRVSFHDVKFIHEGANEPIFSGFTINITPGQRVGLVGHSGSGKTTFTRLLLRFNDITSGTISIDGSNIARVTQQSLRSAIAYVPQEPLLFHRTLRENIGYGNPSATMAQIEHAAKLANALDFIRDLPKGFETLVGERGIKLSGGQRQRIAIARAILKDAPILLLDEATSALDSESEKLIQDSLDELMKGRTSIVIAHRLSTIAKLDRIIVLDNGRVVEDGTHAELLKQKGTYANLWSHQSGGFIEE